MEWTLSLCLLLAGQSTYPRPELLAEPTALVGVEPAQWPLVLDARPKKAYEAGHVPDAVWVDHESWSKAFSANQDPVTWAQKIGALGIRRDRPIVVYDDTLSKDAARIWWILRYWGVERVQILNGGWKGWLAARGPTSTMSVRPKPVEFTVQAAAQRFANQATIKDSLANGALQIVDARSEKEHCGIDRLNNARAGSIPGAKHLEWSDLLDGKTGRFKEAEQMRSLFEKAGIDLNRPTATHCQSGGRASVMAFGMELMGAKQVANYYKGWSEWGNDKTLPIETPVAPSKR